MSAPPSPNTMQPVPMPSIGRQFTVDWQSYVMYLPPSNSKVEFWLSGQAQSSSPRKSLPPPETVRVALRTPSAQRATSR